MIDCILLILIVIYFYVIKKDKKRYRVNKHLSNNMKSNVEFESEIENCKDIDQCIENLNFHDYDCTEFCNVDNCDGD
ncbi:hypothetical protein [Romboutsia lituseburensis]|uniref:Uncharacterized protein n=1 Tax=Romboutsia lituseburensis DSM 797 TaxID=1121325 RepID=A0A1G9QPD9_9FIRM|nr:hypothetical protein [Romboutsia lituseburensis]CEH35614.1 Hypothetical protein RLITU_3041 [Romboutsia lituseburensis]SDM12740.1 hypothetical protein SAMN04515677_105305 [Romboutsia lituseburensis DSM 797]